MKKLIISAVAALILAAPAFAQEHHGHGDGDHGKGGSNGGGHESHAAAPAASHTAPAVTHTATPHVATPAARSLPSGGDNRVRGRANGQPITVDQVRAHFGVTGPERGNRNEVRGNTTTNNLNFDRNRGNNNDRNVDHNRGNNNNDRNSNNGSRNNAHVTINFNRRNVTASHHYRYRGGAYRGPSGYSYRRYSYGQTFPSIYFARNYWISDYEDYGLAYPPEGTVWVRYGNDAVLVDEDSGEILEVVYDQFY